MVFQSLLSQLVSSVEGAEGAVVVAFDGEPVAEALGSILAMDRYGIQLLGAQLRVALSRLESFHERSRIPAPASISVRTNERTIFVSALAQGYFVMLSVKNGLGVAGAEERLRLMANALRPEFV